MELLWSEYRVLHLLYHRSRNQHRAQAFWAPLGSLRSKIRRFLLTGDPNIPTIIAKRVVPACYWAFNTMLNQGQFINLALALLGALARVHAILVKLVPELAETRTSTSRAVSNSNTAVSATSNTITVTNDAVDEGVPLVLAGAEKIHPSTVIVKPSKKVKSKVKAKSKSKHKAKSTMDSIFG